jgi:hypothetical protein
MFVCRHQVKITSELPGKFAETVMLLIGTQKVTGWNLGRDVDYSD